MIPKKVIQEADNANTQYIYGKNNVMYSMKPAVSMFGYTCHAHMIPPFKPNHTLILGYGAGTVAELMRKVWGNDLNITGVDLEATNHDFVEYKIKIQDAKEWLVDATTPAFKDYLFPQTKYDYIAIDLWDGDKVCDFVFDVEFAVRLRELATGLICTNVKITDVPHLKNFHDYGYAFDRAVPIWGNQVVWWSLVEGK